MSADRNHVGVDRRAIYPTCIVAPVASRSDNDDPGMPRPLDGGRERITLAASHTGHPEREVQNSDVEPVVVAVLDDPVDPGDHLGDAGLTARTGNLDAHDPAVRCDARYLVAVVAGDDPGQVRAVPVCVEIGKVREATFVRQVWPVDDLARLIEPVHRGDTRVDQCNVDALTGVALVGEFALGLLSDYLHWHRLTGLNCHRKADLFRIGSRWSGTGHGRGARCGGDAKDSDQPSDGGQQMPRVALDGWGLDGHGVPLTRVLVSVITLNYRPEWRVHYTE